MRAQPTSFTPELDSYFGVVVADGYGIKIYVRNRRLVIDDGFGSDRRHREFHRATAGFDRLVLLGHTGYISLEAIRWLGDAGAALVQIDKDGRLLLTSRSASRGLAGVRRTQAIARDGELGLVLARALLTAKVSGQREVLQQFERPGADEVAGLADGLQDAPSIEALIGIEANAARIYWDGLAAMPVLFPETELSKVPEHWRTFGLRSSPITGRNRTAASPGQAVLNYLYRLTEAETTLALTAVDLDPALGIWHADLNGRASFTLDVLEAVRPEVDRYLLSLLQRRTFRWGDFHETRQGACRLLPPLTHELAKALPHLRRAVLPIVEFVANEVGSRADPPIRVGTPLTGAWRVRNVGSWPKRMRPAVETSPARCQKCGAALSSRRRKFCDVCLVEHRNQHNRQLGAAGRRALERMRTSNDPSAVTARVKRSETLSRRMRELRAWERKHGKDHDWERYEPEIVPIIESMTAYDLAAITTLSPGHCKEIKQGDKRLHPMHWEKILGQVQ